MERCRREAAKEIGFFFQAEDGIRDISKGKLDGRGIEIQRLIGRSLRAAIDLDLLGQRTLWVDCDVLQADGGTRTAAISGATVATALAFAKLMSAGTLEKWPLRCLVSPL